MAALEDTTVLIAEDNADMRQMFAQFLRRMKPRRVLGAADGRAALDLLSGKRKASVGLLITDIQMPRMNGLQLVRSIRCGTAGVPATLPILVVSAMMDGRARAAAEALDVDAILPKPIGFPELQAAVTAALARRPGPPEGKDYSAITLPDLG